MSVSKIYQLWTDGSVMEHTGAWAAILKSADSSESPQSFSGVEENANSNRMELRAVCEGIKQTPIGAEVQIFTDSTYITQAIEKGWLYQWRETGWLKPDGQPVSNPDLWAILVKACECRIVAATWIRSHSGHADNEAVDLLSRQAASNYLNTPQRARKNIPLEELPPVQWHSYPEETPPLNGSDREPDFNDRRHYLVTLASSKEEFKDRPLVREMVYHWRRFKKKPPVRQWQNKPRHYDVVAWTEIPHPSEYHANRNQQLAEPQPSAKTA